MNPSRQRILDILAGLRRAGLLEGDGPISVFLSPRPGAPLRRARQLAVTPQGGGALVRVRRMPFTKPLVFSEQEIEEAAAREAGEDSKPLD